MRGRFLYVVVLKKKKPKFLRRGLKGITKQACGFSPHACFFADNYLAGSAGAGVAGSAGAVAAGAGAGAGASSFFPHPDKIARDRTNMPAVMAERIFFIFVMPPFVAVGFFGKIAAYVKL